MIAKEFITPEQLHQYIDIYACPYDFGFETEYMQQSCPPEFCQGDCVKCWNSTVVKTGCAPNGCLDRLPID